ncbi:MAG: outer membrane lipoprotein-sorting protein [Pseudomonadota bacterium]
MFRAQELEEAGFADLEVALDMVLRSASGRESRRSLRLRQLEAADVDDAGDRLLVVFEEPAAIRGTALLTHAQKRREDDQWLYLPALKRVKKIASRNRSGPFLGSEFSFEDLTSQEIEKYTYRWVGEESCDIELRGGPAATEICDVVERRPGPELVSGYLRQLFWIDRKARRPVRVDYFNQGDRLTKSLRASDFYFYQSRWWRPHLLRMRNHITGKTTDLIWADYNFGNGFAPERDFSAAALRRVR